MSDSKKCVCGTVSMARPRGAAALQWPGGCKHLKVWYDLSALDANHAELDAWIATGLSAAGRACGASFTRTTELSSADVEIRPEWMRASGVLAYAELAQNRCDVRLQMRFNTRFSWFDRSYFIEVLVHELGHILGMDHSPVQSGEIMWWQIANAGHTNLYGPWSGPQLVSRYGEPGGQPIPTPPPPPPPPPIPPEPPMPPELWKVLLDMLVECLKNGRNSAQVMAVLADAREDRAPVIRRLFSMRMRRAMGIRVREWQNGKELEVMTPIWQKLRTLGDDELQPFVDEAADLLAEQAADDASRLGA